MITYLLNINIPHILCLINKFYFFRHETQRRLCEYIFINLIQLTINISLLITILILLIILTLVINKSNKKNKY